MSNDVENYSTPAASNTTDWPEGQAPQTVNDAGRESQADVARLLTRLEGNCTGGGTANAITLTFSPVLTAHRDKRPIVFRAPGTNTGAVTCVVDSLASYGITKDGTTALSGGEIQSGGTYLLHTDTGNTNFVLMNPYNPISGDALTSTVAELNILDGVTSTAAELNILDGVTSTAAELNILDGVTSTAAELNILDGVTSTTAELNILDGVTATAAEINTLDGGKPSFSVHRNGVAQTNITSTDKVEWTTETFDTNNDFDVATNYRFTPTVAGKYMLAVNILWASGTIVANDGVILYLYKNGSVHKLEEKDAVTTGAMSQSLTVVVDANGSTDYFEVFANNGNRDTSSIGGSINQTFWAGCKID